MVTDFLAKDNIDTVISDYSYDTANAAALADLNSALKPLEASIVLNGTLAGFMFLSFVLSAVTLGKPLRDHQVAAHSE